MLTVYGRKSSANVQKVHWICKEGNLEFKQIDSEPFFPRINRFYEFCNNKMNDYKFIDYEVTDCFTPGPRYYTDIENEFNIH